MKYDITQDHISHGNSRPGSKLNGPIFLVAHDTGNPGTTAKNNRDYFDQAQPSASAQIFVDDTCVLEMIPLDEKAYHVRYGVGKDNRMFGCDTNDSAIGVELCYGGGIDFNEAYRRYVWCFAYLCQRYGLDPDKYIVGHSTLDPERRTDPENALNQNGISYEQFISDVKSEIQNEEDNEMNKALDGNTKAAWLPTIKRWADPDKQRNPIDQTWVDKIENDKMTYADLMRLMGEERKRGLT